MKKRAYRHTGVPKTKYKYETIDGNWIQHPVAFCYRYKGVLTRNTMHKYQCYERECKRLDMNN